MSGGSANEEQRAVVWDLDGVIVDSGEAIARQAARVLRERGALAAEGDGSLRLLTTGDPDEVAPVVARVWGALLSVEHVALPAESPRTVPAQAASDLQKTHT